MSLTDRIIKIWDAEMTRFLLVIVALATTVGWIASGSLGNLDDLDQPTATLVAGVTAALGAVLVGVLALYFAWRITRATLRQQLLLAERREVARAERDAHRAIALWLGRHPVLNEGALFVRNPPFEPHLSVPNHRLLAQAGLSAADGVWERFLRMREIARLENELSRTAQGALESTQATGTAFGETANAQAAGWASPQDAARTLQRLREDWVAARADLEATLRRTSRRDPG